jgi:hypothetical protein
MKLFQCKKIDRKKTLRLKKENNLLHDMDVVPDDVKQGMKDVEIEVE